MAGVWVALKKSVSCRSESSCSVRCHKEAKNGDSGKKSSAASLCGSRCSRSVAGLRDVVQRHGSRRRRQEEGEAAGPAAGSWSPRSIGSNDALHPAAHGVVLSAGPGKGEFRLAGVGALRPGTPGRPWPGDGSLPHSPLLLRCSTSPLALRKLPRDAEDDVDAPAAPAPGRASCEAGVRCHRCGDRFAHAGALESHHLSNHAVTELLEGDSARRIVEIICKAGWPKSANPSGRIEKVLKVHIVERSLARFEEFREAVKGRAAKLPKKHPRCLADGNELLRFYGTTVSCPLCAGASSGLCTAAQCNVCRIIKHGFSTTREAKDGIGVFTTSTSKTALERIQETGDDDAYLRKALLVCRVIAGRIHKPPESLQDFAPQQGFDSVAGKVGVFSSIEELYLLNPRALLPCFVVICKS